MSNFVAVYDACVLYPAPLRDLLCFSESKSAVARAVGRLQGRVWDEFDQPVSNRKWTASFTSHRTQLRRLKPG